MDEQQRRPAEINAANNAEFRANAQDVISAINESMPKNTSRNYDPKQREFKVRLRRDAHGTLHLHIYTKG
jgi:hypothetical protein